MVNSTPPIEPNSPTPREPMFNAPLSMVILSALLIGAHFLFTLLPQQQREILLIDYSLFPERFFASAGSPYVYESWIEKAAPLVGHGFLHGDWMHVLMNAVFALAFGAGVVRTIGWWKTLCVYAAAQFGGGLLFLYIQNIFDTEGAIGIGASGGVSGLTGAVFLMMSGGRVMSQQFALLTAIFCGLNAVMAVFSPAFMGSAIAWEAHIGGYIVGAALMVGFLPYVAES